MRVAFLDRDGVINKETNYLYKFDEMEYVPGSLEALQKILSFDYKIIIVTNQAGIAKGYYTEEQYRIFTNLFIKNLGANGIDILDVFHCPHHPDASVLKYKSVCACRKPAPGMLLSSMRKYKVDMKNSFLVGDKITDIHAGHAAKIEKCFLVESGHTLDLSAYENYHVYRDLRNVVERAAIFN